MNTTQFWNRAQLSKDVLAILAALQSASIDRVSEQNVNDLTTGLVMLASAKRGALMIYKPNVSTKWALDTLRFRSAADALSRINPTQQRPEVTQFLERMEAILRALTSGQPVGSDDFETVRSFFRAFGESLIKSLGTQQERSPARYL